jgi:hypothetical protein
LKHCFKIFFQPIYCTFDISTSFTPPIPIEKISEGYQEIARILQKYRTCKLTFLETTFYSIVANTKHRKYNTPESFTDQDKQLENT